MNAQKKLVIILVAVALSALLIFLGFLAVDVAVKLGIQQTSISV